METYHLIGIIVAIAAMIISAALLSKDRVFPMPVKVLLVSISPLIGTVWPLVVILMGLATIGWGLIKFFEWLRNIR